MICRKCGAEFVHVHVCLNEQVWPDTGFGRIAVPPPVQTADPQLLSKLDDIIGWLKTIDDNINDLYQKL